MFMYQEIYNQLEGIQKVIFVFWSVCVVLFCYFYVRAFALMEIYCRSHLTLVLLEITVKVSAKIEKSIENRK